MLSVIRVVHVISNLDTGGSERFLCRLLAHMDRDRFESRVVSLTSIGEVGRTIEAQGVDVEALGMRGGIPSPGKIVALARRLRRRRPDLIQTWMYHADLIGGIAAKLAGRFPVIWNIRHGNLDPGANKPSTLWVAKTCAWLSRRVPDCIIACSQPARALHADIGYDHRRMTVIPNGFDTELFRPDVAMYRDVRRELGVAENVLLVGLVGRFHPQKDHRNFVKAAALVHKRFPEARFVLCGTGVGWENPELSTWIREQDMVECFFLLGQRPDVARLNAAFDVAALSSMGEGFPNVVGEAMACGVPCVVTDVGGSRELVGDAGIVAAPHDAAALASGINKLLEMGAQPRQALGLRARSRIVREFNLEALAQRYSSLYRKFAVGPVAESPARAGK